MRAKAEATEVEVEDEEATEAEEAQEEQDSRETGRSSNILFKVTPDCTPFSNSRSCRRLV